MKRLLLAVLLVAPLLALAGQAEDQEIPEPPYPAYSYPRTSVTEPVDISITETADIDISAISGDAGTNKTRIEIRTAPRSSRYWANASKAVTDHTGGNSLVRCTGEGDLRLPDYQYEYSVEQPTQLNFLLDPARTKRKAVMLATNTKPRPNKSTTKSTRKTKSSKASPKLSSAKSKTANKSMASPGVGSVIYNIKSTTRID